MHNSEEESEQSGSSFFDGMIYSANALKYPLYRYNILCYAYIGNSWCNCSKGEYNEQNKTVFFIHGRGIVV